MNGTSGNGPDETATAPSRLSSLTPEQLVHINLCCDQYERLWRDQGTVSLSDFLQRTAANRKDALQEELVQELVLIDIELRQRSGLLATAEYYLQACASLNRAWLDEQLSHSIALASKTDANELASGQRIGDYVILEPLGAGGMGSVYRAEHVLMKRPVALKIIQWQYQSNLILQRRFEREVRTLAKLSHPNVVTAFDARQDSGWLYLVTELIEGLDLGKLVREKGPLSPMKAAHYARQAANGLHYAHSQGIVHRDIKPENLFLDQSQKIKVLDLGLARFSASDLEHVDKVGLTESRQILGTASYISPEQARAAATADHRSDIYSLGCTLYFLMTGRPPYVGDSLVATIVAHVSEPVPSVVLTANGQPIPPQLDALVQSMMAKHPSDRPKSMSVVAAELATIIKQLQANAQSSTSTKIPPTKRVEPTPAAHNAKVTSTPRKLRSAFNRRKLLLGSLIATPAMAFATYLTFQFLFDGFNRTRDPGKSLSTLSGLRFNGQDNYVEVDNFDEQIVGYVAIEAIVRPYFSKSPTNLVSWTGSQSFVLFRSAGNEWGAAYFDGVTERLILASHSTRPGTMQMVAATWDGTELKLYVDGEPVETYQIQYDMIPAPNKLFIGGVPNGIIPSHQGTRYVNGDISVVRVSKSSKPLTIAADPLSLVVRPETLAMFDFRKPTYLTTTDLTNRWRAHLRGTY
jgi:serine/threonine protein kinase